VFNTSAGEERPDLKQAYEKATTSQSINFSDQLAVQTEQAMKFYFVATLINAHDDLQSVWSLIAKAYLNGSISKGQYDELIKMLTDPFEFKDPLTGENTTFTLDYAKKINSYLSNATIYQTLMREWEDGARNRYLSTYQHFLDILEYNKEHGVPTETQTISPTGTTGSTAGGGETSPAGGAAESKGMSTSQLIVIIVGIIVIIGAAWFIFKK
jgi:hypothetical protein